MTLHFLVNEPRKYDYSSAMVHLSENLTDNIISWGYDNVPETHLFLDPKDPTFGREDDIHITLLYGIHTSSHMDVAAVLYSERPFECDLGRISQFTTNSKFDVLKIEVHCEELHSLHKKLKQHLDCADNYPVYVPHVTIAYLKKGHGTRFVGDATFDGERFPVQEIVFSSRSGTQTKIPLGAK